MKRVARTGAGGSTLAVPLVAALAAALAIPFASRQLVAQGLRADSVVRVLRARAAGITEHRDRYAVYESPLDSIDLERWPAGRGRLAASFEGDTLRQVVASYSGERRHTTATYYIWRGSPFEIRVQLGDTGRAAAGHASAEQRFYFNRGYLVRWIDPHHTIRPLTTGAVFARAMQLMADGTRLIDAAHRLRDHTIEPATPAEIARLMRTELQTLAVAELSYYAERARYTSDIETLGYRPSSNLVSLKLVTATDQGFAARATASALPGKSCVVYIGSLKKRPRTASDHVIPAGDREVACDRPITNR
jgi:hypothetical protein